MSGEADLRQLEKGRAERRKAILDQALREAWTRELLYWVVFEVAGLGDAFTSFEKAMAIKDGHAAAMHAAFYDGRKSVGTTIAKEAMEVSEELWARMMRERAAESETYLQKWNEAQKAQQAEERNR